MDNTSGELVTPLNKARIKTKLVKASPKMPGSFTSTVFVLLLSAQAVNANSARAPPWLIHIPKTGGSSFVASFASRNISVDRFYHNRSLGRTYCTRDYCPSIDCPKCSAWHCPPRGMIQNSVTVVRDPMERLFSEFLEQKKHILKKDRVYRVRGQRRVSFCRCPIYVQWLRTQLRKYLEDASVADCHFMPQYLYASHVDHVLRHSQLAFDFSRFVKSVGFGDVQLLHVRGHSGDHFCKKRNLTSCVPADLISKVNEVYKRDYELLRDLDSASWVGHQPDLRVE